MKIFETIGNELKQFFSLSKHFLTRLVYNDMLKFEDQQREQQIVLLVIFSVSIGYISNSILTPYLWSKMFNLSISDLWLQETLILTITMTLTGMISISYWDKFFLDQMDYINLISLPVRARQLFAAKFFSLLIFIVIISTILNIFSTLIFAFYPGNLHNFNVFGGALAHYLSNLLGSLFVFFAVAFIQSLLMILFKRKIFKKVSAFFQFTLLLGFLSVFVWFPMIYNSLPSLKDKTSHFMDYYPPLWFTGIYNHMIGSIDPILERNCVSAIIAVFLSVVLYLLAVPVSLRQYLKNSAVNRKRIKHIPLLKYLRHIFQKLFLKHPVQHAIFIFYIKTLKRSKEHKLKLLLYLAFPISFFISRFIHIYIEEGKSFFWSINFYFVSIPIGLYFFLIVGLRLIVVHPLMLEANWIFKITELIQIKNYIKGFKKSIIFSSILPIAIITYPFYHYFWGMKLAIYHTLYCLFIALLLLEVCFINFRKLPFASEYVPGKLRLKYFWPYLVLGFLGYFFLLSKLGLYLLSNPYYYLFFFSIAFIIYLGLRFYENHKIKELHLIYEEEPESVMLTLGLD